jgi:gas vesicle protein GvpL/GvpF
MRRDDDPLERLRAAIDQLAASDVPGLVAEAQAEARARVRSKLADLLTHSMLEHIEEHLMPESRKPQPRRPASRETPRAEPESSSGTDPAWYVYGVVDSEIEPKGPVQGVDASRSVELLTEGGVAAVVSQVALEEFGEAQLREHLRDMGWVEMVARAHERVLDQIRAQATVIPMRMCTVYRSDSGVREMLRNESTALRDAIDHLDGKAEWGLKAFADVEQMADAAGEDAADPDADEARGASYMRRRRDERDQRERARQLIEEGASAIHERLCMLAADGHVTAPQRPEVSGHDGEMVLNGVYLVPDDVLDRFHEEVAALEGEFGPLGIELDLTGPWPAYNFVPGTIGAAW